MSHRIKRHTKRGRGRTVETVLGYREVAGVERLTDAIETVVVLRLKGGSATCCGGASLSLDSVAAMDANGMNHGVDEPGVATLTRGGSDSGDTHQADFAVDCAAGGGALRGEGGW